MMEHMLVLLLALALIAGERAPGAATLEIWVAEHGDAVEVHVAPVPGVVPDSIEVELAGRSVSIRARSVDGRRLRSEPVLLREAAVEEGASAFYEPDGSLTLTLRKEKRPGGGNEPGEGPHDE